MDPSQINLDDPSSFLPSFTPDPTHPPPLNTPASALTTPQPTTALTVWRPPPELPQLHALYITLPPHITQSTLISAAKAHYGPDSLTHIAPAPLAPPVPGTCGRHPRSEANAGMLDLPAVIDFHRERLLAEAMERREAKARTESGEEFGGLGIGLAPETLKQYLSPLFFVVDVEDWERDGVWVVDGSALERTVEREGQVWAADVMIRRLYPQDPYPYGDGEGTSP